MGPGDGRDRRAHQAPPGRVPHSEQWRPLHPLGQRLPCGHPPARPEHERRAKALTFSRPPCTRGTSLRPDLYRGIGAHDLPRRAPEDLGPARESRSQPPDRHRRRLGHFRPQGEATDAVSYQGWRRRFELQAAAGHSDSGLMLIAPPEASSMAAG